MRVVIIEDEILAAEKLTKLVYQKTGIPPIRVLRSVEEGVFYFNEDPEIDLIISDIQLLDGISFDIFNLYHPTCPIVFCTAFDDYYVEAFNTNGIGYLLKPYSKADFEAVWDKYMRLFNVKAGLISPKMLKDLSQSSSHTSDYKSTLAIKKGGAVKLLKVQNLAFIRANDDFVLIYDMSGRRHILGSTLSSLKAQLDPQLFFQINRSEIVSRSVVKGYEAHKKSRLAIQLVTSSEVLYTSNSRSSDFKNWMTSR